MNKSKLVLAMLGGVCLAGAGSAQAVNWQTGDWTLGLGGNINAFYTLTSCDAGDLNSGGATMAGLACGGSPDDDTHNVSNGLLPASLNFSATTNQNGYDLGAHINVYYGIASQGNGGSDALAFSTVDARQVYLTFGNEGMGTVTMGRNFGLFGLDAILNDISLVGVGPTFTSDNPGHTTLGGLGYGYVYVDRLTQINWTSPDMGGLSATIGIFNPMNGNANGSTAQGQGSPGFHAKASYKFDGNLNGLVSATVISQEVDLAGGASSDIKGFDLFGKVSFGDLGLIGYYYDGEGMSTLALGGLVLPGFDAATGDAEETSGYYLQGSYDIGNTKLGIHWSESEQEKITLVENTRITLGVYHHLTPALTLMAEYSDMESETPVGTDETNNINVGAILFF
ncbi:MAG: porin [Candidatus Thiodiazotropha sp.]|nr:porin [Candidatus Thiodiazotropha sp.]MCM8883009.1 porin [Candidatus Thiodiazotropha sp.]MCM8918898.1 porin [Candidatus Thiodiazotropha sp.]